MWVDEPSTKIHGHPPFGKMTKPDQGVWGIMSDGILSSIRSALGCNYLDIVTGEHDSLVP